ncbi:hypothetical protein GCM10011351_17480 [Paraliobacillus quinghaiensis]|uniref:Uncharacterized protein n=1 Tax=Paraliobacillus quinghaiensis TaxID=470815 RepID=A0A917WV69_9BACI|nr:hypothetical protein GCM10011351_17480 [Paraliobacillus quinghaiensis]
MERFVISWWGSSYGFTPIAQDYNDRYPGLIGSYRKPELERSFIKVIINVGSWKEILPN